jgi:site-specific DNA recombinase
MPRFRHITSRAGRGSLLRLARLAGGLILGFGRAFGFARGDGFPGAFRAFLGRHGFQRPFPAYTALLSEKLRHFGRESDFLRHASILPHKILLDNLRALDNTRDMRAIGYARVSTDKQADRGVSLEAQTEKVRAMAVVQSAQLVDVIVDAGESAKSLHRPGMARVLSLVDAGAVDVVIVAKLDRLTRSVKDLAELLERFQKRGVSLVSVAESLDTGSAAGRLVLNVMTAVSQWEREAIGERTRDAMSHKRANGERVGTVPFGFRLAADGVHLEAEPGEREIIATIRVLSQDGHTTRRIAEHLNGHGYRTRRGSAWRFEYVASILRAGATA